MALRAVSSSRNVYSMIFPRQLHTSLIGRSIVLVPPMAPVLAIKLADFLVLTKAEIHTIVGSSHDDETYFDLMAYIHANSMISS
jgi:hypothetical protein